MALVDQWSSGPGLLYPLVDPQKMLDKIHSIFTFAEHARKGDIQRLCSTQMRFNHETNKLKLVLAISRTLEAGGWNHEAQRLFQSATETLNGLIWNSNGINNIEILILLALYHYYLDEEVLAGRITTLAARLCIEMGLHRRTVLEAKFPDIDERLDALRTFWSVLMLERSTSISQGIPFMIPDPHADPSLISLLGHMSSQAALSTRSPLRDKPSSALFALLEWSKLAGRAWHALNTAGEGDSEMRLDDLDYLDYQVVQWYEEVPEDLRMNPSGLKQRDEQHDSTCIQGVLYCQKAQLRNLIYQPMLELTAPITRNGTRTLRAVEIAKETLHMLADLNDKSPLVRTHPILFKQSLVAASRNLLSAVANGGSAFLENSKVEIRIALRLVGLLKMRSTFLTQLWQQLQGLQEMYPTHIDFPDNKALFSEYDDYRSSGFEDLFQLHPCV
ncbi:hypothetical protein CDV36_016321 [Fusarium kuroshium]|uniref:Xylanolytic transcriptional activator regulatory domain-containing protein n=1 Tax=Fusarium kuroshium TaxID=2010991 RepID=A0A3M2QUB2_9HYPO|nr:hypothetical protein CDV36_016321 [Fusarium kuroshium]